MTEHTDIARRLIEVFELNDDDVGSIISTLGEIEPVAPEVTSAEARLAVCRARARGLIPSAAR